MPRILLKIIQAPVDVFVTLICWVYFMFGYIAVYLPIQLFLTPFISDRESLSQKIQHVFFRGFFFILAAIAPGLTIRISDDVRRIRSAIVVANHRSYLDPILLVSLFPRQKTIVKGIFFRIPVMRWVMKSGGYIPYVRQGESHDLMIEGIHGMTGFLQKGGVLFIFPEGRRSRNGELGTFQKGAFSIAGMCNAPVEVLYINNTDRLFVPGKFFFNSCVPTTITVERLGRILPGGDHGVGAREKRDEARRMFIQRMQNDSPR